MALAKLTRRSFGSSAIKQTRNADKKWLDSQTIYSRSWQQFVINHKNNVVITEIVYISNARL